MLTLEEVLNDAAESPDFAGIHPVDINTRGHSGSTPLHFMAVLGDDKAARLLLDAGAEIDAADENGHTPLHEGVLLYHVPFVRFLISRGASLTARTSAGYSALDLAEGKGEIIALLRGRA